MAIVCLYKCPKRVSMYIVILCVMYMNLIIFFFIIIISLVIFDPF